MKFRYVVRSIDDKCNLNESGEFGRSFHLIYPSNLQLKCEHYVNNVKSPKLAQTLPTSSKFSQTPDSKNDSLVVPVF